MILRKRGILLAGLLALGMTACGSKTEGEDRLASDKVYIPQFIDFKLDADSLAAGCADGQNLYVAAEKNETVPVEGARNRDEKVIPDKGLYRIPLNGKDAVRLEQYQPISLPEGMEGYINIQELSAGENGTLWVTENMYTYTFQLPEGFNEETDDKWQYQSEIQETTVRRQLDSSGKELKRVDISGLAQKLNVDSVNSTTFDREGNIYAVTEKQIFALSPELQVLFTVEGENLYNRLILLGDGNMGLISSSYDETTQTSNNVMRTIDGKTKNWGKEYPMPLNVYDVWSGSGEYLFYFQNGDSVYGYKAGNAEGEKLFSWVDSDIDRDEINFWFPMADSRIAAVSRKWDNDKAKYELILLTATDRTTLPEKTILTYATMGLDWNMRKRIIAFNKSSEKYRIEIREYGQMNTGADNSAGLTKLNMDLSTGNAPDLLDMGALPIRQYSAKGLLEDLWPYIEKDREIGRERLMEKVFQAAEQDGKLYQIFETFAIQTVAGAKDVVGDRKSWTLAELQAAKAQMPEGCAVFGQYDTKESMLQTVLLQNMNHFVDWNNGKCSFDSDSFKALLEFCNSFPGNKEIQQVQDEDYESEASRIINKKQMLAQFTLYDLGWTYQEYKAAFGGDFSLVGYPREDGSVGSSFIHSSGLAMSSGCKDKEGAWSFMRQLLLPGLNDENNYAGMFRTNKTDFEYQIKNAMTPEYQVDENGNQVLDENGKPIPLPLGSMWISDDQEIKLPRPSQDDYDRFMELYNAIDSENYSDENITKIITEETAAYFAGDRSLDDIVRQIQSRVSLYVSENR
ncbi:extracellular solute-binding protein [Acetatifactor muris]|jgi:ABC-type glycerol-3-phosphate transport system substrate-binding protein|uniref:Bacterial extracellular solute-binding protein n=1 Tax=Acetatifactor muris TaxID=879566 RepID=A0A2K4ZMS0_9FIRM|nr:extracellular solute-binding protein [Acetatifactor muris]MCI8801150.1 extracellular solute-binding protein [Lachnospiraceae bacterium]MCR2050107.1 extracellular solute-binding protein [Acetatifactor muris]SOY31768.1 Bacterial extracellular solute-binding protein [Acetatifactor muris]